MNLRVCLSAGSRNAPLTLLLGPAGNICAPLAPHSCAESGPGPEMVQPVRLERGDGLSQGQRFLSEERTRGACLIQGCADKKCDD